MNGGGRLLAVVLALCAAACGETEAYKRGTIPLSMTFPVERVADSPEPGITSTSTTRLLDVGQPAPDYFDGMVAAWRMRTLFGDLIDEPGAAVEVQVGPNTSISIWDPWRVWRGKENCLIVDGDGIATLDHVHLDRMERGSSAVHGPFLSMRLILDDSWQAAHHKLAVIRLQVQVDGETVFTLTEDHFVSRRFEDKRLARLKNTWSLVAVLRLTGLYARSAEGRDGGSKALLRRQPGFLLHEAEAGNVGTPVLHFDGTTLNVHWVDPKSGALGPVQVRDVVVLRCADRP